MILLRARLAAQRDGARLPIASLFMQAFASTVLCALAPADLPPFGFALFALSVSAFLVVIPLVGELGDLLVRDEADAWVSALPVTNRDLRLARLGHLCIVLGVLTLGALIPAAFMAAPLVAEPKRAVRRGARVWYPRERCSASVSRSSLS